MPPPHLRTDTSRNSILSTTFGYPQMVIRGLTTSLSFHIVFVVLVLVVACVQFVRTYNDRRKRRKSCATMSVKSEKGETPPCVEELPRVKKEPTPEPAPEPTREPTPETFRPVYPWIAPPQPLPGPYDPRLYPLPTLRRHSHAASTPGEESVETGRISYTRRVSTNTMPPRHSTVNGTVSIGTNGTAGWRRNQWVVEGG